MKEVASKLATFPVRSISLGYRTLQVVDPNALPEAQLGYSRSPDGDDDLTADDPGAWQGSWVVIGHEDECGDPIFVDTADPDFPVFTAAHGQGEWEPRMIAESLGQFSKALRYLKPLTAGRESPMEFEGNPFDDVEAVLEKLGELTACPDAIFWTDWLRGDAAG